VGRDAWGGGDEGGGGSGEEEGEEGVGRRRRGVKGWEQVWRGGEDGRG